MRIPPGQVEEARCRQALVVKAPVSHVRVALRARPLRVAEATRESPDLAVPRVPNPRDGEAVADWESTDNDETEDFDAWADDWDEPIVCGIENPEICESCQ